MPAWVEKELSHLAFSFFWSGKWELVSRSTVVQPHLFGDISIVNVKFKVYALLGQWVRRFASSPLGWYSLMSFWFSLSFGVSPITVLSRPFSFDPGVLLPFYSSLLPACRSLNSSFSTSHNSLALYIGRQFPQCHSHTLLQGYSLPKACISFYYVIFKFSTQLVKCVLPHSEVLHSILIIPLSLNQSPPMLAPWLTPNCFHDGLIDNYQQEGQNKGKCLLDQKLSHPLFLFQTAYFPSSSLRSFLCLSSGLQIECCSGSCLIERHFVLNFRLRGYPAKSIWIFTDVNRTIIE